MNQSQIQKASEERRKQQQTSYGILILSMMLMTWRYDLWMWGVLFICRAAFWSEPPKLKMLFASMPLPIIVYRKM